MLGLVARLAIVGLVMGAAILSLSGPFGPAGLLSFPYAAMGAVLIIRRPRTSIGWILIGMGACFALVSIPVTVTPQQFADGSVDLPVALFAIIHSGLGATVTFLFAVLVMVFPSGRLSVGRWGRLGRVGLGAGLVVVAVAYVMPQISVGFPASLWVPNPIAVLPDLSIWRVITPSSVIFPVMILVIAGSVSLVVRVRRAGGTERQQLRWIAASFTVLMTAMVSGLVVTSLVPDSEGLAWIPAMVAFPLPPVAVGIAVLRYRLYDLDRLISRTVSWAVVTGVLVITFAVAVVALQAALARFTQGQTLAVAGSTLVAFALFHPLRRHVQSVVDRRFNRSRYDAQRTVEGFSVGLRDEFDLERLGGELSAVVGRALAPTSVGVWLRSSHRIPDA